MTKSGVEGDYRTAVDALTDSIQNFEIYGANNNKYGNKYGNNNGRSPYPSLEMRHQTYDKDT